MKAKWTQEQLDAIWQNIKKGKYKKVAGKLLGFVTISPERLFSDECGDAMSIPNNDGTHRDYYRRKPQSAKWEMI
jgi:hypothetical protein